MSKYRVPFVRISAWGWFVAGMFWGIGYMGIGRNAGFPWWPGIFATFVMLTIVRILNGEWRV
jgi:hypothetical protein